MLALAAGRARARRHRRQRGQPRDGGRLRGARPRHDRARGDAEDARTRSASPAAASWARRSSWSTTCTRRSTACTRSSGRKAARSCTRSRARTPRSAPRRSGSSSWSRRPDLDAVDRPDRRRRAVRRASRRRSSCSARETLVFGVEPEGADSMHRSFAAGIAAVDRRRAHDRRQPGRAPRGALQLRAVPPVRRRAGDGRTTTRCAARWSCCSCRPSSRSSRPGAAATAALCGPLRERLAGKRVGRRRVRRQHRSRDVRDAPRGRGLTTFESASVDMTTHETQRVDYKIRVHTVPEDLRPPLMDQRAHLGDASTAYHLAMQSRILWDVSMSRPIRSPLDRDIVRERTGHTRVPYSSGRPGTYRKVACEAYDTLVERP